MKKLNTIIETFQKRGHHVLGRENFFQSAVLLPLIEKDDELHVLFEVRARHLKRQPGDICFPGGRMEAGDKTLLDTAVRETVEELGIEKSDIEIIAPLDYLVTPFSSIVYPYLGLIRNSEKFAVNTGEVERVFTVPLSFFQQAEPERYDLVLEVKPQDDFPYHLIEKGKNYDWRTGTIPEYFYFYEEEVIWGLTARILRHFLEELVE